MKANNETSILLSLDALMIEKEEADKIREGIAKLIDAAHMAYRNMEEAKIGIGSCDV
mgnify:CR=1 FL=1